VTHDQEEALAMSDYVAVMNNGRVEQSGVPWEIYYHPRTAFLADFVGAVNLLAVDVLEQNNGTLTVRLDDHVLTLPSPTEPVGAQVLLCIRPESLTIQPKGSPGGNSHIQLSGTVTRQAFLGNLMRYWVQAGAREWIADQPDPGASAQVDGVVTLAIPLARVHVIAS
jgi:ABC-type Fe3+/spermidine/putrescine transport system ATPase subunit